jgi:hypothetical protein
LYGILEFRMRTKALVLIGTLFILSSMLFPFGRVQKAFAVNGDDLIGPVGTKYCSGATNCQAATGLAISQMQGDAGLGASGFSDAEALQLNLNFASGVAGGGPAVDQVAGAQGNGNVDWNDLLGTAWDAFYSQCDFDGTHCGAAEGKADNGFFIQVGTGKTQYPDGRDFYITNDVTFDVIRPTGASWNLITKTSNPLGKGFARALGPIFWNDPARLFGQTKFTPTFVVSGLQANTQYYARVIAEEDGSNDYFWSSPILEFHTIQAGTGTTFATSTAAQALLAQLQTQPPATQGTSTFTATLRCGISSWTVGGCFIILFDDVLVKTSQWIAQTSGRLFDVFAAVSLGHDIYGGKGISSFIENSWATVRDISNIFFIFILLYAALGLVLSLHSIDVKKLVSKVIIVALLINFSLFFCRIAIDASNILSRVFYNAMNISQTGNAPITAQNGDVKEQSMSAAIVQGIQPQKLLGTDSFNKLQAEGTVGNGTIFFILLLAFVLNLALAWIFFMCAAFFAGRIGVIWVSMIFAPIAFVSSIVPGLDGKLKQLGWSQWLSTFLKACINAPIFFFFMYLIVNLTAGPNGGILNTIIGSINSSSLVGFLVGIILPTMILLGLLREAKSIAQEMGGEFGAAFAGVIAAGAGLAAMAATGGAAIAGRGTIGALATKFSDPSSKFGNTLRNVASGTATSGFGSTGVGKWMARQGLKATVAGKSASFDVRNTGLANSLSKATGVDMNVGSKIPFLKSFSTENTAGGMDGKINRQAEKDRKFTDSLGYDKPAHDAVGKTIEGREEDISKQESVIEALQGLVQQAKIDKENGGSGTIIYKDPATGQQMMGSQAQLQLDTNAAQDALRVMKKGGDKTNPAHVWSAADAAPGSTATKADGTKVTSSDVGQLKTNFIGVEKLKKAQENLKTARAKEFLNDRIVKSGKVIHESEKRDSLGNITKFAHADMKTDWKQFGKNMGRDLISGLVAGGGIGAAAGITGLAGLATAGMVTGAFPAAALGAAGFGLAKVLRSSLEDGLGGLRHEVAHLASDTSHQIHKSASTYKSPTSSFTDMFKSTGGGGGGGHAAPAGGHGGGHDDHGGGHGGDKGGGHH